MLEALTKMEPTLRLTQVLKQKTKDIGLTEKEVASMSETNRHWIEKRGWLGEIPRKEKLRSEWQSYKQMRKTAAELQAEKEKRADEIQIAKIEADKELELKAQQDQSSTSLEVTPPTRNKDAKSPKLPSFIDE